MGAMELGDVKDFVGQVCQTDSLASEPATELKGTYEMWCFERQLIPVGPRAFAQALRSLGYLRRRRSTMHWLGIRIVNRFGEPKHPAASASP